MVKPIGKMQVYEAVSDSMIENIKSGSWPVGERIPGEIELAEAYQVSRNSVRTAIKVLVSYNMLDCKPGVGTFVTDNALDEIHTRELLDMLQDTSYEKEVTAVRGVLDKEIAYQAALMCTDEDVKRLEECIENNEKAGQERNIEQMVYWGSKFHDELAVIAGNKFMVTVYRSLKSQFDRSRLWYLKHKDPTSVYEDNKVSDREILEAVKNHDAERARSLMAQHLNIREHGLSELSGEAK